VDSLGTSVRSGLEHFLAGDFRAAHEAWEEGWRSSRGAERELLQALAQLSAAFLQWQRGKAGGASTLFGRARRHLGSLPSTLLGVEVSELELQLGGWEEAAARGEPPPATTQLAGFGASQASPAASHRAQCPYCGDRVQVQVDAFGVSEENYVEDCPVCCRPWTVHLSREADAVRVRLSREDD
jgi:hypothetical protein